MSRLKVWMFGKFSCQRNGQIVKGLDGCKLQELFCYLLLNRNSPHPRETLAALLWGDSTTSQSKKYLRQAIWQLQSSLDDPQGAKTAAPTLCVEPEWISLNPHAEIWLDVIAFEQATALSSESSGAHLDKSVAQKLDQAVHLYRGDLLEGCYQDWCLCERERLQNEYLMMLDKLMNWCESNREYQAGLRYGQQVMRYERARESTHQQMMRLYYLAGDRTRALRQYERCVAALDEELGVRPAKRTMLLYEQIRADEFLETPALIAALPGSPVPEVIDHLRQLHTVLTEIQRQVQKDIQAVDLVLNGQR